MPHCEDSICLLTSTDPENRGFGTGFVFHRDGTGRSFLLTCLHVVEALEQPHKGSGSEPPGVLADGLVAEVWVRGDSVLDLVVLAVDGLAMEPLVLGAPITSDRPIQTTGYTAHEPAQQSMVPPTLNGTVRDRNPVKTRLRPGRVGAWTLDIEIELDPFRELTEGYSGSPVVDVQSTEVVGIMNLKRTGRKGHAVCVESFKLLFEKPNARPIPGYSYPSEAARRKTQGIAARSLPEKFLVAFSFAGEQRHLVRAIAQSVETRLGPGTVFFDEWYEYWLAGADADLKLQNLYATGCALAVVCVSGPYGEKPWTCAEHEAIRARLMQSRASPDTTDRDAILPIRVGDGDVPGVTFNAIVPDVRERPSEQTAGLILQRLRYLLPDAEWDSDRGGRTRSPAAAEGALDWLASTLDHVTPIDHVARCLDDGQGAAQPRLWFYAFDACHSDCPRALAEHMAVVLGGLPPGAPWLDELVTELHPVRYDEQGLWKALAAKIVPLSAAHQGQAEEADYILRWINAGPVGGAGGLRVVYCPLSVADMSARIPGFIAGAVQSLGSLRGLRADARALFLFACIFEESGLRGLLDRWRRPRLDLCKSLGALDKLSLMNLDTWLGEVAQADPGGRRLDAQTHKRLRDALEPLFPNDAARLRYKQIRRPALDILAQATLVAANPGDPP